MLFKLAYKQLYCINACGISHPFHNDNNAVKLSFDYKYQILGKVSIINFKVLGVKICPHFGTLIVCGKKNVKTHFNFRKVLSVLLKSAGTQGAQGSQQLLLARAEGPLRAQLSDHWGLVRLG